MTASETAKRLAGEASIRAQMESFRAAEAAALAQADIDRAARAILMTYSPRRQWTTRYGAVFVEGIGFTSYGY